MRRRPASYAPARHTVRCLPAMSLVLACLQFGCSTQPHLRALQMPPQRVAQQGYSFLPPAEPGWVEALRNPSRVMLGKFGENPDETFAIQALVTRAPEKGSGSELIRFVREEQERDVDPKRHRVLKHEVIATTQNGAHCARSYIASEDNAARKRSARAGIMLIDALSLTCRHPKNSAILITITYSHRFYPENQDPELAEKAARVFHTLELVDY